MCAWRQTPSPRSCTPTSEVQKRLVALGTEVVTSESPQAFKQFVVDKHKMWGDVVKKVGVTQ